MFNQSPRKRKRKEKAEKIGEDKTAKISKFYEKPKSMDPRNSISHKQDTFFFSKKERKPNKC